MYSNKDSNKVTNDSMFVENQPMVSYNDIQGSTPFQSNSISNPIPKIKIEDISYQNNCSSMNWQRSDCYHFNTDNNCLYPSNYSDPSMASSCANGLVYTDLSNQYNQTPVNPNNYQLVYSSNLMPQLNSPQQAINEPDYQNRVDNTKPETMSGSQSSAITVINTNGNVSPSTDQMSDSLQTLAPSVLSALNDSANIKNIHFIKTIEFLRSTDLLNLTLQTAELIKRNLEIQKEINQTKQLLSRFVTT